MTQEWYGSPEQQRISQVEKQAKANREAAQQQRAQARAAEGDLRVAQVAPEYRKLYRLTVGWTAEEVGHATGVPADAIRRYEARDPAGQPLSTPDSTLAAAYRDWVVAADNAIRNDPELQQRWLQVQQESEK